MGKGEWVVVSCVYVDADRNYKTVVTDGENERTVYFPMKVNVGEAVSIKG